MRNRLIFFTLLSVDALLLVYVIPSLSISYHEAQIFFNETTAIHYIINFSTSIFGQNNFALRLPMIILHILSVILLYAISKPYIKYEYDRLWLIGIYMLLPGINSAALLVDDAGLILFLVMLYIYLTQKCYKLSYFLLPFLLFIDEGFIFLYLGVSFYAYEHRKHTLFSISATLFILSLLRYGFDVGGAPQGQFLDTLGIYAVIFSPIVFLYLFYVLYRRALIGPREEIFYVGASAFILSLLLSFRQRVDVAMFAPYLMVTLPLAMQSFFHAYRVRLRMFRTKYRVIFLIAFILLIFNALSVFFNKEIYYFLPDPKKHFAYRLHIANDLAKQLHVKGITCIDSYDKQMQLRLRFYDIGYCTNYKLNRNTDVNNSFNVTVLHRNIPLYRASVTKVHD